VIGEAAFSFGSVRFFLSYRAQSNRSTGRSDTGSQPLASTVKELLRRRTTPYRARHTSKEAIVIAASWTWRRGRIRGWRRIEALIA
jgi:hypothetical protein